MEVNDWIIDHSLLGRSRIGLVGLLEGFVNVHHEDLLIAEGHTGVSTKRGNGEVSHHGFESSGVCTEDCGVGSHECSHPKGLVEQVIVNLD